MGELIEKVKIGTNRHAAPPNDDIRLYTYGDAENLTLGQLVNAICCRAGMALETESVVAINRLTAHNRKLKGLSQILQAVMEEKTDQGYDTLFDLESYGTVTARQFLTEVVGVTITAKDEATGRDIPGKLPVDIDTVPRRLAFYDALKETLNTMTTQSQQRMIDLQTCLSRRDVAFTTTTNVVQTLGGVLQTTASNY